MASYYPRPIRFCNQCGHAIAMRVPDDGDTRMRAICPQCQHIQYQNPLNVVGTLPVADDGRILLCKRNIEPRFGTWTLPAGFMELDETLEQGAARETVEEAGADIALGRLFSVISVPEAAQVHIYFLSQLRSLVFNPGFESQEVRLFAPKDIPWDELSFRTVSWTLRRYLENPQGTEVHQWNVE